MARLEMKEEVRQWWIEDLLSGEYEQARGVFCTEPDADGMQMHCCLSVLSKRAEKHGIVMYEGTSVLVPPCDADHDFFDHTEYCTFRPGAPQEEWHYYEEGDLPDAVRWWAGIKDSNPFLVEASENNISIAAIDANDAFGWTFEQIAHAIKTGEVPAGAAT